MPRSLPLSWWSFSLSASALGFAQPRPTRVDRRNAPQPAATAKDSAPPLQVLIVDDQPNLSQVTAVALRQLGCHTMITSTGSEAVRWIEAGKFEAVMLDVSLGDECGLELLSELRARGCRTPVIVFTAHTSAEIGAEALGRGAFACLYKPFTLDELRGQIDRLRSHLRTSSKPVNVSEP